MNTVLLKEALRGIHGDLLRSEQSGKAGAIIYQALQEQPEFSGESVLALNVSRSPVGFLPTLPAQLWTRIRESSVSAAVDWLGDILATPEAEGIEVQAIYGVALDKAVTLASGVELMRFAALPPSHQKSLLSNEKCYETTGRMFPPTAAIVRRCLVRPLFMPWSEFDKNTNVCGGDVLDWDELRYCIGQAGPTAVGPGLQWFQFTDEHFEEALIGKSYSWTHQEVSPIIFRPVQVDLQCVPHFIECYLKLNKKSKERVHTALERLQLSLIRSSPADRSIEVSIALETMLMSGERGDNTHKVGLRSALMSPDSDRVRVRELIAGVYGIRSSFMHEGIRKNHIKVGGEDVAATEAVVQAANVAAHVIRRIVEEDGFPDWWRLELSGGADWIPTKIK